MTNKRILYWDIIKFFAIFCVVYGHAIQNLNPPNRSLWDSPMENYIISFHMPLFMIVSGYFARTITKLRVYEIIKKKFRQFIIPSVTTYFLTGIILIFLRHTPFIEGLQNLLGYCVYSYWFLKALFIFYVLTTILYFLWKKIKWLSVICIILLLLLPVKILDYVHCISMYPFFIVGLLLWKYEDAFFKRKKLIILISLLLYISLSYFYTPKEYNMYDHLFSWNSEYLLLYFIRILIGISASFICIICIRELCIKTGENSITNYLAKIGTCTLGIYVFQQNFMVIGKYYCIDFVQKINPFKDTIYEFIYYDYIFCLACATIITLICTYMVIIIRKTKYLRLILLGEK